ncbi:hypothetical protein [Merismopedia glauca]|uniref:Uncharacterized protein n=1 Tax=Merismopedia glauca CCAP 1448/3 TaxID=1296344 RepID=A0A2T1C7W5_9CYAN|nr:hypothetical protein [Merismopedia glauca]PSB04375.1 hypothetical protein C7B64_04135 [Merismopedia glauca CCAP 1448/3]
MIEELLSFKITIDPNAIAGISLWSLGLYLALSSLNQWIAYQLQRWFNFAERSLYTSEAEFERTRKGRESQNAFFASLFSIVPFLLLGALCHYGVEVTLGTGWSLSLGAIATLGSAIYELGRRDGQENPDE